MNNETQKDFSIVTSYNLPHHIGSFVRTCDYQELLQEYLLLKAKYAPECPPVQY